MNKAISILNKLFNAVITLTLSILVLLVFLNVVLRYVFNSGITWSVELSGFLFVWLIFMGAVIALKEHGHLGVDLFVGKLPLKAQKGMFVLTNIVMIAVLVLFIHGLTKMMELNSSIAGPATGIPVNVMYLAGFVAAVLMILIMINQIIKFVFFNQEAPPWANINSDEKGGADSQ